MKLIIIIALSIIPFLVGCGINFCPGEGEKIGQIVKLSKQGLISDTWEAELIRGGMNNGSGAFGTTLFHFTIENDLTAKEIEELMRNQTEVIIKYKMEGIWSSFRSDSSGHFLISVKKAN